MFKVREYCKSPSQVFTVALNTTPDWFEELTGFAESSPSQVHDKLSIRDGILRSSVNDKEYVCGTLETPSLFELREQLENPELRERLDDPQNPTEDLRVRQVVADARDIHVDQDNSGAMIQAASQFNLLEMVSPANTPEMGVGIYQQDRTQGPTCAIAAGAGTIYRNYFASVNGQRGQTKTSQIDCLDDIGDFLGNEANQLWTMTNGYLLTTKEGLAQINTELADKEYEYLDNVRSLLRIGIQWNTQVTANGCQHVVSQAYCSALPVRYNSGIATQYWEIFARLILEAGYEATICASILNSMRSGSNKLFLTLVGGGAFGNNKQWIMDAIHSGLTRYGNYDLDVSIVSHGHADEDVENLVSNITNTNKEKNAARKILDKALDQPLSDRRGK